MSIKDALRRVVPRSLWETLRQAKIARSVSRFPRKVVEHDYAGHRLKVLIADGIGKGWYDKDWDSLEDIGVLSKGRLKRGAKVFDLGAHQSVVAMIMAKTVGPTGQVIAVEGMAHNCEVAQENLRLNKIENVEIHHAVVSDKTGSISFFDGLNGTVARDGVGGLVEAVTIDGLAQVHGNPDVVFIDVEGYELNALKGATSVLSNRCDWFVEVHVGCGLEAYGGSAEQVLKFFAPERFTRFAWRLNVNAEPKPLELDPDVLNDRFAFVALHK